MKVPRREQGLKDLHREFNVPTTKNALQPEMRDAAEWRGPLAHVPREPIYYVQDFGAPGDGYGSTQSPASASFTAGKPTKRASEKELRQLPANQRLGSVPMQPTK